VDRAQGVIRQQQRRARLEPGCIWVYEDGGVKILLLRILLCQHLQGGTQVPNETGFNPQICPYVKNVRIL
jgi:hypothetical protein